MSTERVCFYVHTNDMMKLKSSCDHSFVPQLNMKFCPFCGGSIRRILLVSQESDKDNPELTK